MCLPAGLVIFEWVGWDARRMGERLPGCRLINTIIYYISVTLHDKSFVSRDLNFKLHVHKVSTIIVRTTIVLILFLYGYYADSGRVLYKNI